MLLRDLAKHLECRLEGDGGLEITRVASLEQAGRGDVSFVANAKYQARLEATRASAVILGAHDTITHPVPAGCAVLWAENPYLAFAQALRVLNAPVAPQPVGIDERAIIASGVTLGEGVSIGPFAVVGAGASIGARTVIEANVVIGDGARIGDDCAIRTRVTIRHHVVIGNRVIVQDGAVIGSEGFGFVRLKDGHYKIPQDGTLIIEDDVEIGANTTIDRPAVGETRIGAMTKIDNLVQVAHGVLIGKRVLLAAQVGLAGSTIVEDDAVLAGQVGVAGHLTIGKGAILAAQSGVISDIEPGTFVTGYPAMDNRAWRKSSAIFKQLPEMRKRIGELERKIAELEETLAAWQTPSDRS